MQPSESAIRQTDSGVEIAVKVVPGASRDRIVGWLAEALKVTVTAPPEAGKANKALCRLIAKKLGVKPAAVSVVAGQTSPRKKILVTGLSVEQVTNRLP